MAECGGEMGLAGARVADEQNVLFVLYVFALGELEYEFAVDAGLGGELESIECLDDWEFSGFEPSLGGALFAVKEFSFSRATRQKCSSNR